MLALAADLAFRCATLNPQLGEDAPRATPGVVLIDEIDLHLHPRWQRRVIDDLRRAFPRLQFVTTTHSPFVIQTRGPGELINLSRPEAQVPYGSVNRPEAADFRTQGLEDIAEEPMGVANPAWSRARQQMWDLAGAYYTLLDEAKEGEAEVPAELRRALDEIEASFSDNVAFHAFLTYRRAVSGVDDET